MALKLREKGTSLNSDSLAPKPLASSVYVRVPEARCPNKRSISVMSLFPSSCERGVPGDGPRPREERPGRGSEWRRRRASRTASAFLGLGGEIHTLMSSPGPRPRGGMMPRNDTLCGRDAHQGLAEGLGPWRVGWSGPVHWNRLARNGTKPTSVVNGLTGCVAPFLSNSASVVAG